MKLDFTEFIQRFYQSLSNLPNKIKDGAYIINLDEYNDIETHWIALYALNKVTYFNSVDVENIPNKIKTLLIIKTCKQVFLGYKQMTH